MIVPLKEKDEREKEFLVDILMDTLLADAKKGKLKPVVVIIDEAHKLIPQTKKTTCKKKCVNAIMEGRKFGLGVMVCTQRPAKIDKDALSQCATQVVHKVMNRRDTEAITQSVEGMGTDDRKILQKLDVGEALVMGGSLKCPLVVKIRERRSEDRVIEMPIGVG